MGASAHQNVINRLNAVLWGSNLSQVDWLHDPRRRQQERAVGDSTCRWDDLSRASENRLVSEVATEELKLAVLHLLFAEGTLACSPLETVHNRSLHHVQLLFIDFTINSVINEHIRASFLGAKRPNRTRCEFIPFKFVDKGVD